ncbi:hypothetical protein O3Q51_11640 [Cryomorphaceae bacterium 1068]|nr:hypothetical protein [Cryomorphaceae bacterium 1068]
MKNPVFHILLLLSLTSTSCIFTIGWDDFKTEHIVSDFYLESMNDDGHILVLKEDEGDNGGTVIVPSKVVKIGNNDRFIAAVSCCNWTKEHQDTTYFIIDLEEYNKVSWFKKFFNSYLDEIDEYKFKNESDFNMKLDSLTRENRIELNSVE